MALRFNKRIKIAPGVKVNVGLKGVSSVTVGRRGASVNMGKKDAHLNIGVPGTGLSTRTKVLSTDTQKRVCDAAIPTKQKTSAGEFFVMAVGLVTIFGILVWLF
ncbi:DUF4236 domain-containing protein [Sulfitobacter sp.]|uniref:DUF4236 domain-containing protein n=1 Tax=Sulfitobacter sp. TaxID=1903071 RepID=UPI003569E005